jgi:hypothetical protein
MTDIFLDDLLVALWSPLLSGASLPAGDCVGTIEGSSLGISAPGGRLPLRTIWGLASCVTMHLEAERQG